LQVPQLTCKTLYFLLPSLVRIHIRYYKSHDPYQVATASHMCYIRMCNGLI